MYVSVFTFPICQPLAALFQSRSPHYYLTVMIKYFTKLCFLLAYGELSLLYRSHQYLYRPVNSERSEQMVSCYEMLMKVFLLKAVNVLNIVLTLYLLAMSIKRCFFYFSFENFLNSRHVHMY